MTYSNSLNLLLADDDEDDRLFFERALAELPIPVSCETVNDGRQLMEHLKASVQNLPDALFLDLNMPLKNGVECLNEIKKNEVLKEIPVIIYSTSLDEEKLDYFFDRGAHYYICKPADFQQLKKLIHKAVERISEDQASNNKPSMENFLLNKL